MMKSRNDGLREEGEKNPFRPLYPIDLSFFFFFEFIYFWILPDTKIWYEERNSFSFHEREIYKR